MELLARIDVEFGVRFQLAGDMTTCEEGGTPKKLGTQLTKENCLKRCLQAGEEVCNNVEYGNINSNFQCVMYPGECKTERLGNSIIYKRRSDSFLLLILFIILVLICIPIVCYIYRQREKTKADANLDAQILNLRGVATHKTKGMKTHATTAKAPTLGVVTKVSTGGQSGNNYGI